MARYRRGEAVKHICLKCAFMIGIARVKGPSTDGESVLIEFPPPIFFEVGAALPSSQEPLLQLALEFGADLRKGDELLPCNTHIEIVDVSTDLLEGLRRDPAELLSISPEQFEQFLCGRLSEMGLDSERVGSIYAPDGGIDIVSWPRERSPFPFLLAVQAKHHADMARKVGPGAVRQMQAIVDRLPFQAGLIVTNTAFTANARWVAQNRPHLVRLRDFDDLKRWIFDNFLDETEWREIPESIEYMPGRWLRISAHRMQ